MNGYERISAALRGEKPDRVPVMLHNFLHAAREAGFTMRQFRENPENIAQSFIRSVEKYGYDGIMIDVDTVTLAGALGVAIDFPELDPARSHNGLITNLSSDLGLIQQNIENYRPLQIWLESVRLLKEHFGDEIYIRGNCDQASFTLASLVRGTQNWLTDLFLESPDQLQQLLEICTAASCRFISLMAQTGAHMVSNGDSASGSDMISPDLYREFALPYQQRIAAHAHGLGLPWILHICGNTEPILQDMIATGADGLELDYKTDARLAHDLMKGQTVFVGNIDPSGVIALGSAALVRQKCNELLSIFSDTPRFILNAGCAIPAETPEANIFAMMECVKNNTQNG